MTTIDYRKHYNAGWRASSIERVGDLTDAENRYCDRHGLSVWGEEHGAWLDGWMDKACNRQKYHLQWCDNHGNADGECGEA